MEGGDEGELNVSTMSERQAPKPTGENETGNNSGEEHISHHS